MGGGRLGAVDVAEGHEEAVTDAQHYAADVHSCLAGGADLDCRADGRECTRRPERRLAAEEVCEETGEDGGEERAESEKGADQLLECALLPVVISSSSSSERKRGVMKV